MWDVAIIGAGLTGITCARQLRAGGYRVCVLDKSRGVGGRLSTRRVNDHTRVDHGLPYWSPKTSALKALTDELLSAGVLRQWPVSAYEIRQRESLTPVETDALYVATEGMSAIAKYLAQDLIADRALLTDHKAVGIRSSEGRWEITCEGVEGEGGKVIQAQRCVIAIPAPQAVDLLEPFAGDESSRQPISAAIAQLRAVDYHPCLSVLAGYSSGDLKDTEMLSPNGWMVSDRVGTSTAWIGLDSSKRDSSAGSEDTPVVVIHSKADFARQYIDAGDLQPAASVLLRANARKLGDWIAEPKWLQIHRWRYAQVNIAHPEAALAVGETLVCGGDWCKGPDAETAAENIDMAYLSGSAIAQRIQTQPST
ncbi:MAG: FAD-dependent oxidoreductase [Phormidesmis sp.]